jgi:hypothetical protein
LSNIIQGLWIGKEISLLEKLSMSSFIKNGHEYHLYTYNDVVNVPDNVIIKDGNEILSKEKIFSYQSGEGRGSFSAFSNFFRYKLLSERGGWWADTDMICLRPFDFEEEYVFSTEFYNGTDQVTSGLIKVPQGSDIMQYAWDICRSKTPDKIVWGEVGPRLVAEAVERFSLQPFAKPHKVFMPLGFEMWMQVLMPSVQVEVGDSYSLHLWNEMWRRNNMDKNKTYSSTCYYEKLKRKFLC